MASSNFPEANDNFDADHTDTPGEFIYQDVDRLFAAMNKVQAALGNSTGAPSVRSLLASINNIRGKTIPTPGQQEHGKTWVYDNAAGAMVWTALPSTQAGGDLEGTVGTAKVVGVQGKPFPVPTPGDDGKAIVWSAAQNAWALADVGAGGGGVDPGGGTETAGITEGFEDNDLANWTVSAPAGVSVGVTAAAARSGSYGLRIVKPYASASGYARWPITASSDVTVEGRFRYRSQSGQASNGGGLRIFAGGVRIVDVHRDDVTGQVWIRWRKSNATYAFAYTNVIVGLNEWVRLRLRVTYAGAGSISTIATEINGVAVSYRVSSNDATPIAGNTFDLSAGNYDVVQLGSEHTSQLIDCDIDDLVMPARFVGTTYHVDSVGGADTSAGTLAAPWKTVAKVNAFALQPGDSVLFKRGGQWNEALNITANGTSDRRIRIGAYGTGARPIFDGGGNFANGNPLNPTPGPWPTMGSRDPFKLTGNWIVAEEMTVQQAAWGGLMVVGDDCIARRFTAKWNVAGVHTLAGGDRFEAHDYELISNAVMSVNAPGSGGAAFDDSGSFGHAIFGADGYFHHATSTGHRATSYDFGTDGSCIEVYGGKRNRFSAIVSVDDEAFSELGNAGTEDTSYDHCVYVSLTGEGRVGLNVQGALFGSPLRTKMEHCTIFIPAGPTSNSGIIFNTIPSWAATTAYALGARIVPSLTNTKANGRVYEVTVAGTTGAAEPVWPTVTGNTVVSGGVTFTDRGLQGEVYNCIVVAGWKNGFTGGPIAENYNLYFGHNTPQIRSTFNATPAATNALGPASKTAQSPLFVSTSLPDLHLQAGSPAIDAGTNRGYLVDFDGNPRLVGAAVDMGAYERQT